MRILTSEQQIKVLENIKWTDLKKYKDGLCYGIMMSLRDTLYINVYSTECKNYIPLFTRENAIKFGANSFTAYWWPFGIKGNECRKQFVDWMIDELKKEL